MAYYCRVERDSVSPVGDRLTTFVVTYPRSCIAEVRTHRVISQTNGYEEVTYCEGTTTPDISKNSASSRAIPLNRMVRSVKDDPYVPEWTLNRQGMQGATATDADVIEDTSEDWLDSMRSACFTADRMNARGIHKQDCNRLLEPFAWVTQVLTSSAWDNFFALRCHHMAYPPFRKIARMMYLARRNSTPTPLDYGQWHLPFVYMGVQDAFRYLPGFIIAPADALALVPYPLRKSAACCAWVSYENHDQDASDDAVNRTFARLFGEAPVHGSPLEHQATPMRPGLAATRPELRSNLSGWLQARKLIATECVRDYRPSDEEVASWGINDSMTGN
jgi:hypothetical protein